MHMQWNILYVIIREERKKFREFFFKGQSMIIGES